MMIKTRETIHQKRERGGFGGGKSTRCVCRDEGPIL
jgi:hypothetical protein